MARLRSETPENAFDLNFSILIIALIQVKFNSVLATKQITRYQFETSIHSPKDIDF